MTRIISEHAKFIFWCQCHFSLIWNTVLLNLNVADPLCNYIYLFLFQQKNEAMELGPLGKSEFKNIKDAFLLMFMIMYQKSTTSTIRSNGILHYLKKIHSEAHAFKMKQPSSWLLLHYHLQTLSSYSNSRNNRSIAFIILLEGMTSDFGGNKQ